ncbi:uncharacterized protein LOC121047825 [Ixodes scapularis]|uniref:uncharacterized protein LOC121047825 n=1 Tax=Ixodes scapularis TaxID=6945 RepID=UPI001C38B80D|nr:uncharacterized protein LOC121047825 [Ixodes scapularis]
MYFILKKETGEQVPPSEKVRFEKFNTHGEYVKHMQDSVVSPLLTVQGSLLQATIAADSSRKVRLTASILSKVPKKTSTSPDNFVNSCLHSNFRGNKYTEHGKLYEPVARAAYQQKTGRVVTLCGAVVSATHPFLSASPDGLSGHDSILEIKCPATGNCRKYIRETRDYDVKVIRAEGSGDDNDDEDDNDTYFLAKNGKRGFYFQVQFTMFCTERTRCFFYVWSLDKDVLFEVDYDQDFTIDHITRFSDFYFQHYLPRLVNAVHDHTVVLSDEYAALANMK